jgi:hypothetical protein
VDHDELGERQAPLKQRCRDEPRRLGPTIRLRVIAPAFSRVAGRDARLLAQTASAAASRHRTLAQAKRPSHQERRPDALRPLDR